jgi:hypothetical protein
MWRVTFFRALMITAVLGATMPPLSRADRIQDFEDSCIHDYDWSQVACQFVSDESNPNYRRDWRDKLEDLAMLVTIHTLVENTDVISRFNSQLKQTEEFCSIRGARPTIPTAAEVLKFRLTQELLAKSKEKPLSTCQKACLVLCASSHLLKYNQSILAHFESVSKTLNNGDAVCVGFSKVAAYFGEELGLSVLPVSSDNHEFIQLQLNGTTWYAEPQTNFCRFFKTL